MDITMQHHPCSPRAGYDDDAWNITMSCGKDTREFEKPNQKKCFHDSLKNLM
jgi:hypothetical protein